MATAGWRAYFFRAYHLMEDLRLDRRLRVYLASDESSFMTGSELVFDGGWTAQ